MPALRDVLTNMCLSIYELFATPSDIETLMAIGDQGIGGIGPAIDQGSEEYNAFYNSINGQLFEDDAPPTAVYPYAVYNIDSTRSTYTFDKDFTAASIKMAIYSDNMDTTEIKQIYRYASDLFDDCLMVITGSHMIWMKEDNLTTMLDNQITPNGTKKVLIYTIDFEVFSELK